MRKWIRRNWSLCLLYLALATVAVGAPVYAALSNTHEVTWVQVVTKAPTAIPPKQDDSRDAEFGRQLDILTSFYETVIGVLLLLLATITALAFLVIRATSRKEAERIALEVVESAEFKRTLNAKVAKQVEEQVGNLPTLMEDLSYLYESLDDILVKRKEHKDNRGNQDGDRKAENEDGDA